MLIWVVPLYDYGFFALPSGSVAINFLTPKMMGQSWYQLQQKTQECTISDHRHLCWKMWRNLELLIHKGMFLSQPRKTPHYLYIEFIVFPFRLKSENFIVFRNTCNLCYSLVIAMSIKTDNHQLNWSKVMWLFAKWCPVLPVFTLYFWFTFLAYSLRDFILIPYQNLLDLIWVVRTIVYQTRRSLFY